MAVALAGMYVIFAESSHFEVIVWIISRAFE